MSGKKDQKDQVEQVEETQEDLEESAGSETLKPMGGSGGGESRAQMLATFTSLLAQLGKEDLSHFLNDALAQIGKEAESTPSATAPTAGPSAAQGTGAMPAMPMVKLAVKEDVNEMFAGEELTEEFKEKATTLFEAAIEARLNLEVARIQEEHDVKLEEQVNTAREEIANQLDKYLDYVVEQWVEENRIALDTSIRAEIAEDFMEGLYKLFNESYISVPEDKVDVLGELNSKIEELEQKLEESTNKQIELQSVIDEATKEATFDEISEGLVATQVERFRSLAEGIEYNNVDTYRKKLEIIKEKYFSDKKVSDTKIISEAVENDNASQAPVAGRMAHYVSALGKTKINK